MDMSAGEMFCKDINVILSILSISILSILSNTKYPKVIVNPWIFFKLPMKYVGLSYGNYLTASKLTTTFDSKGVITN